MARIELSNPDKVLFPEDGLTKADLAAYYESVAEWMVPHVRDRPLNLWRWNTGIGGRLVVQQDIEHVLCQDADTLRWLANQNCITPHVWSARRDRLDRPDHIVFDFDPEAGSDFTLVREGALLAGERLRELGLEPFAKLTGSKGIHVIAPIKRTRDAPWVRERAGEIGVEIAGRSPDTLTTEWRKEKRDGKILVDTARNTYGQTVVAPYAVRALEGAPVATPLVWEELSDPQLSARAWTLHT
ncbi:MAG: ATP-dependent DNA ligase, partial [Thermoleophilia bacterium]|nr:ATP-dependent DNA ligase [Thermoleophilia bacterium]